MMTTALLANLMNRVHALPTHNGMVKLRSVEDAILDAYNEEGDDE